MSKKMAIFPTEPAHFTFKFPCPSSGHVIQHLPETRTMIHLSQMSQFMAQHIINKVRRGQHEPKRQIDIAQRGATPPPCVNVLDGYPTVAQISGQTRQPFRQNRLGLSTQRSHQHTPQPHLHSFVIQSNLCRQGNVLTTGHTVHHGSRHSSRSEGEEQQVRLNPEIIVDVQLHQQQR